MKHIKTLALAATFAASAHAQYTAPAADATWGPATRAQWEIDAGVGFLAATNIDGADDGVAGHIAGYYLEPLDSTRETTLKYGVEFFGSDASGKTGGVDADLTTYFASANLGLGYRMSRHFEAGIIGGVGMGGADYELGGASTSTALFGFFIRPEVTAWITESVGVSLSYRFLQTVALNDSWDKNPNEHAIEFGVKWRF